MRSCGLLLYRLEADDSLSVWIGHMGGPFWRTKDAAAWSIPKGEPVGAETDLDAALREFAEEIGHPAPPAEWTLLGEFEQPSRKVVVVFTAQTDFAAETVSSNLFEAEWPPRSGRRQWFPEIDDARWVSLAEARVKVVRGQVAVLDALEARLSPRG
ncbi:MAG: putative pyrophosphohydrolase [Microbacteriaceae bacterium]|jgi:predicted NUDIX family NTP pyrophosphohydrolase|nr:putative pyrophosphohydrolase [Microbacteriaceae bacterium]